MSGFTGLIDVPVPLDGSKVAVLAVILHLDPPVERSPIELVYVLFRGVLNLQE